MNKLYLLHKVKSQGCCVVPALARMLQCFLTGEQISYIAFVLTVLASALFRR